MQWVSSLLITSLASPLCVHPCRRIVAREEANKKRLATECLQTLLNLSKESFRDIIRKDHFAVRLVGGHVGVVEGEGRAVNQGKGGAGR